MAHATPLWKHQWPSSHSFQLQELVFGCRVAASVVHVNRTTRSRCFPPALVPTPGSGGTRMSRKFHAHLPGRLSELIENRLSLYSLGAVTAGVSLLALAPPAEGSVVVTQTSITVVNGTPAFIDMNND